MSVFIKLRCFCSISTISIFCVIFFDDIWKCSYYVFLSSVIFLSTMLLFLPLMFSLYISLLSFIILFSLSNSNPKVTFVCLERTGNVADYPELGANKSSSTMLRKDPWRKSQSWLNHKLVISCSVSLVWTATHLTNLNIAQPQKCISVCRFMCKQLWQITHNGRIYALLGIFYLFLKCFVVHIL